MLKKVKGVKHKQVCRALPSEDLTRTVIKSLGDDIKIDLSETGEVCSPGGLLPEQYVGVLVGAALPRTVRVGEVDLVAVHLGERFARSHFTPPIVGQGQTPLPVDAVEHGSESSHCRSGSCMIHFCECDEERSLNQRANGGFIARTLDQIALPRARHDAVFDFRRAHLDADHVRNGAAPIWIPSARPPTLTSLAQAGDLPGTQLTARHGVECGADGLMADLERRVVRLHSAQYERDLFRRRAVAQAVRDSHQPAVDERASGDPLARWSSRCVSAHD